MGNFAENLNLGNRFRTPPPREWVKGAECPLDSEKFAKNQEKGGENQEKSGKKWANSGRFFYFAPPDRYTGYDTGLSALKCVCIGNAWVIAPTRWSEKCSSRVS